MAIAYCRAVFDLQYYSDMIHDLICSQTTLALPQINWIKKKILDDAIYFYGNRTIIKDPLLGLCDRS